MTNDARKRKNSAPRPRRVVTPSQKMIRPYVNQSPVPEGFFRYWCSACMESFLATEEPTQCAKGHRVDDPELNGAPSPMVD